MLPSHIIYYHTVITNSGTVFVTVLYPTNLSQLKAMQESEIVINSTLIKMKQKCMVAVEEFLKLDKIKLR